MFKNEYLSWTDLSLLEKELEESKKVRELCSFNVAKGDMKETMKIAKIEKAIKLLKEKQRFSGNLI